MSVDLRTIIRDIPDFPCEGVVFKDITPILHNPDYLRSAIDMMTDTLKGIDFDLIAGPESRGFIFGVPVSVAMGKGFIPVRKAGKLPYKTVKKAYDLEYGSAEIEIHADAVKKGDRVVVVDDLLATGGTSKALCELIESVGGEVVRLAFLIELDFLNGRKVLDGYDVKSLVTF